MSFGTASVSVLVVVSSAPQEHHALLGLSRQHRVRQCAKPADSAGSCLRRCLLDCCSCCPACSATRHVSPSALMLSDMFLLCRPPRVWVEINHKKVLNMVSLNFLDAAGDKDILVRTPAACAAAYNSFMGPRPHPSMLIRGPPLAAAYNSPVCQEGECSWQPAYLRLSSAEVSRLACRSPASRRSTSMAWGPAAPGAFMVPSMCTCSWRCDTCSRCKTEALHLSQIAACQLGSNSQTVAAATAPWQQLQHGAEAGSIENA